MKQSKFFIPTLKNEVKEDGQSFSYQVMQKAGMIKQVASGIYTYLPLSFIIIQKIEDIIREELNNIECYELLMPALQPKEVWEESGRWSKYGPELFRLTDRHDREFCLGPTHEEIITTTIRDNVKSWKALPLSLFQIQTKFRDEKRPRFGLMRGREFIMKDAYSFHTDYEDLSNYFDQMGVVYQNIFDRCGLKTIKVSADSGAIGGFDSAEFMSVSEIGEDVLVYCDKCGYQANLEKAEAIYNIAAEEQPLELELIDTPNVSSIKEISSFLNINENHTAKYITYKDDTNDEYYLVVIPGNYEINETKLTNLTNAHELRLLDDEELKEQGLIKGFIGTINLKTKNKFNIVVDNTLEKLNNHTAGANEIDKHYININFPRDYQADFIGDIKEVNEKDLCLHCQEELVFAKGIEVGHIFKLGDTYSKPLKCNYLDQNQKEVPMQMGCYGLGVSRVLMAVVETWATANSMLWPKELQPFDVHLILVDAKKEEQAILAEKIYQKLLSNKINVLFDDRQERVGSKFADSDLIGIGKRIIVGKKASENIVEYLNRFDDSKVEINADDIIEVIGDNHE